MSTRKIYVQTFGCQMNVHDSEQMIELLRGHGYEPTREPKRADLIIVNTCSIREKADQKAYSQLGRYRGMKERKPGLILGVSGCLAQQLGGEFFKKIPGLDFVLGTHNIHRLPSVIASVERTGSPVVETAFHETVSSTGIVTIPERGTVTAFVTIMQGCNNFCAFCVVPYLRGAEESRKFGDIVSEIRLLAASGVKEVTLLGQNVNSYGKTLGNGHNFASLLRAVGEVDGIERIRFTTSHPRDLTGDIIRCFKEVETVCEHIHLPVQSGSDRILERMNRCYTMGEYLAKVERLREACPDISITSDMIVGFPGETEKDFRATLDLMENIRFDGLFSFKYSARPGTGASQLDGKVPEAEKGLRLRELQALQDRHTLQKNLACVGRTEAVLVEGYSKQNRREFTGRTRTNRIVNFGSRSNCLGRTVSVRISAAYQHSLRGEPADGSSV
ncbi:MAG TPA: tRNA (N6-isopentenyl adenosine(37)-C2)-methylthiotransferase MiaB [Syntrophales bacterium]|nr:tRNA (N6-isopentenyl adenosine(37)-C2)-methylthiotransferase MiaB [Syntrophales bacterium]HPI57902.1 tRNA (N6-isopentenyl adenosine(37)-C2)-methylthiotransferase MiaB [Syntrophales bacterium]HPN24560.1 tRNA (N6-isopentenyl adenosine(37)-C2)-methylthiotransferase MiaB [Syntrophales bacterium]HQM28866.1 tRNA (N6-isopentenyl adenosine(37)-C2)-methylthiotransferase MiaB [Syntrophales bacterium]